MTILFIIPYPIGESPSQRFRFEQYFTVLKQQGHEYETQSFLNLENWKLFYSKGNWDRKLYALLWGFLRRINAIIKSINFDIVFIHRESAPLGPPIFEWVISKILGKKIIYDFDDAIWLTDKTSESSIEKIIKWRSKVASICKWSYKISCGNAYLCDYAKKYNSNVILNPTTIDSDQFLQQNENLLKLQRPLVIGWTGSHSTLKYLQIVENSLKKVITNHEFHVIANKEPQLKSIKYKFIKWNKKSEVTDLSKFDIGIMPLPDDLWSRGKCGFKALQYMSMGIPCVASPVGVNTTIINHGVNGFLASNNHDWVKYLSLLISDEALRKKISINGRDTVIKNYSLKSNSETFLSLFE